MVTEASETKTTRPRKWPTDFSTELSLVNGQVLLAQASDGGEEVVVAMSVPRAREVALAILELAGSDPNAGS